MGGRREKRAVLESQTSAVWLFVLVKSVFPGERADLSQVTDGIFDADKGAVALDSQRHVVSLEIGEDLREDSLVRVSARAPQPDPPDAERHVGADLQELGADGAALSSSKLGALEADPP